MNYFTVFLCTGSMLYMTFLYYETWFQFSAMKMKIRKFMSILVMGACLSSLVLPMDWYLYGLWALCIFAGFIYEKETAFVKCFGSFLVSFILSLLVVFMMDVFLHDWYAKCMCFLLVEGILHALLFLILRKQSEGAWFLLIAYGVLLGIMIQFVWLKKSNMMHIEHMLPFLLFLMITLLNRFAYVQKQQYETMLSITNRRHLAKENVIQYERLQKDNDEILRQIHDLRKQMKLLNNKTIEENDTLTKKIMMTYSEVVSFIPTGCPLLDRVLRNYQKDIMEQDIQLILDVEPFAEDQFDPVDMSAIFCNMVENAIESCVKCKQRVIQLKIRKEKGYVFIKMKNSCESVHQVGERMLSTKEDTFYHGFGLRNMQDVAQKYQGDLHCYFDQEHQLFITKIYLALPHVS